MRTICSLSIAYIYIECITLLDEYITQVRISRGAIIFFGYKYFFTANAYLSQFSRSQVFTIIKVLTPLYIYYCKTLNYRENMRIMKVTVFAVKIKCICGEKFMHPKYFDNIFYFFTYICII